MEQKSNRSLEFILGAGLVASFAVGLYLLSGVKPPEAPSILAKEPPRKVEPAKPAITYVEPFESFGLYKIPLKTNKTPFFGPVLTPGGPFVIADIVSEISADNAWAHFMEPYSNHETGIDRFMKRFDEKPATISVTWYKLAPSNKNIFDVFMSEVGADERDPPLIIGSVQDITIDSKKAHTGLRFLGTNMRRKVIVVNSDQRHYKITLDYPTTQFPEEAIKIVEGIKFKEIKYNPLDATQKPVPAEKSGTPQPSRAKNSPNY